MQVNKDLLQVTGEVSPEQLIEGIRPLVSRMVSINHWRGDANGIAFHAKPPTDLEFEKHFAGKIAVGLAFIRPGASTTSVGALDLDSHKGQTPWPDMVEVARSLIDAGAQRGIRFVPFRSRGGAGIHLYAIWDAPQDAFSVRAALCAVLQDHGFKEGTAGVHDRTAECFPKQSALGPEQVGSMIFVPGTGQSVPLMGTSLEPGAKSDLAAVQWLVSVPVAVIEAPTQQAQERALVALDDAEQAAVLDRLKGALAALPNPDLPYADWTRAIWAIHEATGGSEEGRELAREWSMKSSKHDDATFDGKVWGWASSSRDGKAKVVSGEYVFSRARAAAWTDPAVVEAFPLLDDDGDDDIAEPIDLTADREDVLLGPADTQDGVARVAALRFKGRLKYSHSRGAFYWWADWYWKVDQTRRTAHALRTVARNLNTRGQKSMTTRNFARGVEDFVASDPRIALVGDEFDRDNYLLATHKGTVNLRTGELRAHEPADLITSFAPVAPQQGDPVVFTRFLREITCDDDELARFLQVSLGACLSGAVESHWMLFWIGAGRNGKSTLAEIVAYIMGDYARKVPASVLLAQKHESHPTEIANLQGCRLALSSEIDAGAHWAESRIAELTGDETLSARYMRGDFFTFRRTHKHLVLANHRPQLRNASPAIRARMKMVPFKASFIGREDHALPAKLRAEAGQILAWLIAGHKEWVALGRKLPPCAAVDAEVEDYFSVQSTVEHWLDERVQRVPDDGRGGRGWPTAGDLYNGYTTWKKDRGEQPVSLTRFGETMRGQFKAFKSGGQIRYVGALLRPGSGDGFGFEDLA
jgi:P4 family phage/plasmid primase-like protien